MLRIHTKDGRTTHVDLKDENQARALLTRLKSAEYQDSIAGVSLVQRLNGTSVQYSLPRPEEFGTVFYHAEGAMPNPGTKFKGGEKIVCFVDDVRLTMLVHSEQHSVRISVKKMGRHKYNALAK